MSGGQQAAHHFGGDRAPGKVPHVAPLDNGAVHRVPFGLCEGKGQRVNRRGDGGSCALFLQYSASWVKDHKLAAFVLNAADCMRSPFAYGV